MVAYLQPLTHYFTWISFERETICNTSFTLEMMYQATRKPEKSNFIA